MLLRGVALHASEIYSGLGLRNKPHKCPRSRPALLAPRQTMAPSTSRSRRGFGLVVTTPISQHRLSDSFHRGIEMGNHQHRSSSPVESYPPKGASKKLPVDQFRQSRPKPSEDRPGRKKEPPAT